MASAYATRLWSNSATFIRHRFASVFISYSSPRFTCFEAFTCTPLCFTFPLSQAAVANVLVLNKRIAHRYLSMRSFSDFAFTKVGLRYEYRMTLDIGIMQDLSLRDPVCRSSYSSLQKTYGSMESSQSLYRNY